MEGMFLDMVFPTDIHLKNILGDYEPPIFSTREINDRRGVFEEKDGQVSRETKNFRKIFRFRLCIADDEFFAFVEVLSKQKSSGRGISRVSVRFIWFQYK